jgi:hypothetical protein
MASASREIYLPWIWATKPIDPSKHKSPTVLFILLTYLAVNSLTSVLGIMLSHRTVVRKISCGLLGKDKSNSWKWLWVVQLGLHFGADIIAAYITIHAAGWDQERAPKFWDLALFYASRPRLAWLLLGQLGIYKLQKAGRPAAHPGKAENSVETQETDSPDRVVNAPTEAPIEGDWTSAAKQTLIAEAIMQVVGTYYLGRTAHYAASHGYYQLHRNYDANAKLMYGGALFTLIITYASLLGIWGSLYQLITRRPFRGDPRQPETFVNAALMFGYGAYIGSWLFWSGYVKLAGDLYVSSCSGSP